MRRLFGQMRLMLYRFVPEDADVAEVWRVADANRPGLDGVGTRMSLDGTAFGTAIRERRDVMAEGLGEEAPRYREEQELARDGYLMNHFLARLAAEPSRRPPRVSEEAWRVLETYAWPGNIRELQNVLERALLPYPGPELVLPPLGPWGAHCATGATGYRSDQPDETGARRA